MRTSAGPSDMSFTRRLMPYTWMGMGVIGSLYHARFRPDRGARGTDEVPREDRRRDDGHRALRALPEHEAADPEEREVDDGTAEEPLDEPGAERGLAGGVGGDGAPARPARTDAPVERAQVVGPLGGRQVRDPQPDDRRKRRRHEEQLRETARVVGGEAEAPLGDEREDERRRHRAHLRPRVHPPPVPAQEVDEPRAGAD